MLSSTLRSRPLWYRILCGAVLIGSLWMPDLAQAQSTSKAREAAAAHLGKRFDSSRYMARDCGHPILDWPRYEGRPVRRCVYSQTAEGRTLVAVVYLLNPSAGNIADRIGNACAAIGLGEDASCGVRLAREVMKASNGQFPVAGLVIEPRSAVGGVGDGIVYLEFRDGVTVRTEAGLNFTDAPLDPAVMDRAARARVVQSMKYARILSATREDYRAAGGREPVGTKPADDKANRWPDIVRANELNAQDTGEDALMVAVAARLMKPRGAPGRTSK